MLSIVVCIALPGAKHAVIDRHDNDILTILRNRCKFLPVHQKATIRGKAEHRVVRVI
tara:strand:+ start:12635 stop:12805 length:171 start_codon:yes stop_codon:yes gene_type:complete